MKEDKHKLRNQIERLRSELHEQEHKSRSRLACRYFLEQPFFTKVQDYSSLTVCTYMPFQFELDITPVIEWCWLQGCRVLIPKVVRDRRMIRLHIVQSYGDVETGVWGIDEPKDSTPEWDGAFSIDVMIVPGVAFDRQGGRLGYGGGYYDRFIESYNRLSLKQPSLSTQTMPLTQPAYITAAFDLQLVAKVPMEAHDLKVSQIITESGPQIKK